MHSVYLIRHGKSSLDGAEAERGLEPEGFQHAEYLAERLHGLIPVINAIYCSPYRRAILTMEPLSKRLDLPIQIEHDFHEKRMADGPVENLKAVRIKMWEDFDFRLPGGESNAEAQRRAMAALDRVRASLPSEALAVGSHGTLIGLILNAIMPSFGYEDWRAMPMPDIFRIDFPVGRKPMVDHVGCPGIDGFKVQG